MNYLLQTVYNKYVTCRREGGRINLYYYCKLSTSCLHEFGKTTEMFRQNNMKDGDEFQKKRLYSILTG